MTDLGVMTAVRNRGRRIVPALAVEAMAETATEGQPVLDTSTIHAGGAR
jgi:hypothetical protein